MKRREGEAKGEIKVIGQGPDGASYCEEIGSRAKSQILTISSCKYTNHLNITSRSYCGTIAHTRALTPLYSQYERSPLWLSSMPTSIGPRFLLWRIFCCAWHITRGELFSLFIGHCHLACRPIAGAYVVGLGMASFTCVSRDLVTLPRKLSRRHHS